MTVTQWNGNLPLYTEPVDRIKTGFPLYAVTKPGYPKSSILVHKAITLNLVFHGSAETVQKRIN